MSAGGGGYGLAYLTDDRSSPWVRLMVLSDPQGSQRGNAEIGAGAFTVISSNRRSRALARTPSVRFRDGWAAPSFECFCADCEGCAQLHCAAAGNQSGVIRRRAVGIRDASDAARFDLDKGSLGCSI